ncbi:MAG: Holliday junction resolvase RuvX [Woeseiaceae bacterium]
MPDTPESRAPETIIAFDFGLRRIGVAVGQSVTGSATPIGVVGNSDAGVDHHKIAAIIDEWRPATIVVGMPLHTDGRRGDIATAVDVFIAELGRHELPIETVDERFTSVEAGQALKLARQAGTRGRISKEMIDSAAAVFIAERYLSCRE